MNIDSEYKAIYSAVDNWILSRLSVVEGDLINIAFSMEKVGG